MPVSGGKYTKRGGIRGGKGGKRTKRVGGISGGIRGGK